MRRLISIAAVLLFCVTMLAVTVSAASARAALSGPAALRAGDTITVSFELGGDSVHGVTGTLSYDAQQLRLSGITANAESDWLVEYEGDNFIAYDRKMTTPINENITIFTATFEVDRNVAAGATVNVSCIGVVASDGIEDIEMDNITYSGNVAEAGNGAPDDVWIWVAIGAVFVAICTVGIVIYKKKQ